MVWRLVSWRAMAATALVLFVAFASTMESESNGGGSGGEVAGNEGKRRLSQLNHAARVACRKFIRSQAFPSQEFAGPVKFAYGRLETATIWPDGVVLIGGWVEMHNRFGALVPHLYACDVRKIGDEWIARGMATEG